MLVHEASLQVNAFLNTPVGVTYWEKNFSPLLIW